MRAMRHAGQQRDGVVACHACMLLSQCVELGHHVGTSMLCGHCGTYYCMPWPTSPRHRLLFLLSMRGAGASTRIETRCLHICFCSAAHPARAWSTFLVMFYMSGLRRRAYHLLPAVPVSAGYWQWHEAAAKARAAVQYECDFLPVVWWMWLCSRLCAACGRHGRGHVSWLVACQ